MPRLPAINPADAPDEAKPVLDAFYRARGNYPNMFRTLAVRPAIMRTAAEHMKAVTQEGTVPAALKELCVVLVSTLNASGYRLASHTALSRRLGTDDAKLAQIRDFASSSLFSDAEKAALTTAHALTRDPTHLAEPVWNALRVHFDDGQIVEIICTIGLFSYFNRLNNALEMELTV